jgi:protein TorT
MLNTHGSSLDYIIGCTGCAPAAAATVKGLGLSGKVKVVAYDLTHEIAAMMCTGEIAASVDTKAVSQARVATDAVVNFLEGRMGDLPHTILIRLGVVDPSNFARYPFDTTIAPTDFEPVLFYSPDAK